MLSVQQESVVCFYLVEIQSIGTLGGMQFLTPKSGDTKGDKSIPVLDKFHRTSSDIDNAITFLTLENNA